MPDSTKIVHQPPGEIFPWPRGWKITALDEAVLAAPSAIISANEVIGNVIRSEDDVRLKLPAGADSVAEAHILIFLKVGQSVFLTKSCQAIVLPNFDGDKSVKRFKLSPVMQKSLRSSILHSLFSILNYFFPATVYPDRNPSHPT
jgi:hypothetical protein